MYSRRQWFMLSGAIVALIGLARIVEAEKKGDGCKDVGENRSKITESAKITHDAHALIDGPWCGADNLTEGASPWRVRYSSHKQGLKIQYYNTLEQAEQAVERYDPTGKYKMD